MLSRTQKRVVLGAAILVLLVLIGVPYIHVNHYRESVANSLSQALGRSVTVQSIELQTFPQPGLLLHGVVVSDDPSISAEPMLRADDVLATLRFTSLWRGRLEISTLKLQYPSLNLVRANDGRWNIESLLERARQTPTAPTTSKRPETRTRFPYIEATGGRINLKIGQEKKVFALGDADFALWIPAEDEWRMRLEAQPIRTDANLSDTGTVKVQGSWRRAAQLRDTPVNFKFWWDDGQLGQLTTLVYGRDRGWRGSVRVSGLVLGTPEDLKVVADARLEDFRHYDIATGESVSMQTHCDAFYRISEQQFHDVYCQSPLGGGAVIARGTIGVAPQNRSLDLSVAAENVSAQFLATLARHMKKSLPADLMATGMLTAALTVRAGADGERLWAGNGDTSAIQLRSAVLEKPLVIEAARWHLLGPGTEQFAIKQSTPKKTKSKATGQQESLPEPDASAFGFEPVALPLGGSSPATLRGWFTRHGFFAELKGDAELERVFQLAQVIGLPAPSAELSGTAKGSVRLGGNWGDPDLPGYIADAQLHHVVAKIGGVASPMTIQTGRFIADKTSLALDKATASFAGVRSGFVFNAMWPKNCVASTGPDQGACGMRFDVTADEVYVDELNSLLNPKAQKRPWYAAITNTVMRSDRRGLPDINATGKIAVGKLFVKGIPATRFNSNVSITPTGFALTGATAEVFGGKFAGAITSDFHGGTPVYSSTGRLQGVAINNVAAWMRDAWASGKVNLSYEGKAAGWNSGELLSSAAGKATFEWHDGTFHHIELDPAGKPLQFRLFAGALELKDSTLTINESKLQAQKGIYQVSGTASLGRELELKLARDGAPSFSVSGPLERPKVAPLKVPQTQATLR